jgi:Flp pilus assembly CpaE family ATPase
MMVMDKLKISRARIKLVLNRVGRESGISQKDIETALKMPVFAVIPADDKNVNAGLNQGIPTAYSSPTSDYGRSIQLLSEAISGTKDVEQPVKGSLLGRWFSKKAGAGA